MLTLQQKAVLALRDDLESLFTDLNLLNQKRLNFFEQIAKNENHKRYYLKSNNITRLLESIEDDNDIIDKLNVLEFEIQEIITKICNIAGIEYTEFERYFTKRKEALIVQHFQLKEEVNKTVSFLVNERDATIKEMNKRMSDIKTDIDSFANLLKFKTEEICDD